MSRFYEADWYWTDTDDPASRKDHVVPGSDAVLMPPGVVRMAQLNDRTTDTAILACHDFGDEAESPGTVPDDGEKRLIAAAPALLAAHDPYGNPYGPDFLDWVADRLVHVHGEPSNADFILALRRKATAARRAIERATQVEQPTTTEA